MSCLCGWVPMVQGILLSGPPGCSGANRVRSYTFPLTMTQQSSGVACLSSSDTEILGSEDMVAGVVYFNLLLGIPTSKIVRTNALCKNR